MTNTKSETYIVEWEQNGEIVTDTTPRSEFEAIDFAIKKSIDLRGEVLPIVKSYD